MTCINELEPDRLYSRCVFSRHDCVLGALYHRVVSGRLAAETGAERDDDSVAVLRAAISAAVRIFGCLYERAPGAGCTAEQALMTVADAIDPVGSKLKAAARSEPYGPVAATLTFLRNANDHLATGDVEAARAALVTAHVTLARLDGAGGPDRDRDRMVPWDMR